MEIMYVERRASRERETMMLKARVEPRLMRQRMADKTEVR